MTVDWTISVGNILVTVGLLAGWGIGAWRLGVRLLRMERKVNFIFAWFLRSMEGKALTAEQVKEFFGAEIH